MLTLNLVLYTTIKPTHTLVHLIKEKAQMIAKINHFNSKQKIQVTSIFLHGYVPSFLQI